MLSRKPIGACFVEPQRIFFEFRIQKARIEISPGSVQASVVSAHLQEFRALWMMFDY